MYVDYNTQLQKKIQYTMGTLTNFVSTINKYGVRTQNLFAMKVSFPNGTMKAMHNLDSGTRVNWQKLENELNGNLFCFGQGFTLPARTINYADVGFQGYMVPVPTTMSFGTTHAMTFNDDMSGSLRSIFALWQNATINGNVESGNFEGNRFTGNSLTTYTADLKIYLLSNEYENTPVNFSAFGEKNLGYILKGVTVASIGETTLSNTAKEVAILPIEFRSQYWQMFNFNSSEIQGLAGRNGLGPIIV